MWRESGGHGDGQSCRVKDPETNSEDHGRSGGFPLEGEQRSQGTGGQGGPGAGGARGARGQGSRGAGGGI